MLVTSSAVGYYGDRGADVLTEDSAPGTDFLARVCVQWEDAARPAAEAGVRVAWARIGVVLDPRGGVLARMLWPFRLGLGGRIGPGTQYLSWITLADTVAAIRRVIDDRALGGPVNLTAPNPVTNAEFAATLGRAPPGRPPHHRTTRRRPARRPGRAAAGNRPSAWRRAAGAVLRPAIAPLTARPSASTAALRSAPRTGRRTGRAIRAAPGARSATPTMPSARASATLGLPPSWACRRGADRTLPIFGRARAPARAPKPVRSPGGRQAMDFEHILWSEADGVATLTLNRPDRLNSLHPGVIAEMIEAVDRIRDGLSPARCLVLTGAGRGFSSGADLSGGGAGTAAGGRSGPVDAGKVLETHFNVLLERLFALPVPLVTAVNGPAAGAGCSYALAGDIIVAAESAYFLQAFVNIGLVPDVGSTWMLPRMVGRVRATRMMMLGEKISAAEALEWGMVTKVVPDAALMDEAMGIARKLAAGPTRALAMIRTGIRDCMDKTLTEALMVERRNQMAAGRSADFAEGVMAFLEKRPAKFSGA